ncbi:MAG: HAD-IC family P-type ATPase, partial [Acetobacteraceae bacterium]|nr:HAD-IC family P-type ATPase [Acetobacteraceae bacterium]
PSGAEGPARTPLDPCLAGALEAAVLCSDARLQPGPGGWEARGDPTEAALLEGAARVGVLQPGLEGIHPRIAEIPFDPGRRRMAVVCRRGAAGTPGLRVLVKGAPDAVVPRCSRILAPDGRVLPLDAAGRARLLEAAAAMASGALRVLSVAARDLPGPVFEPEQADDSLTFLGLMGLADPPRRGTAGSVRLCREAGVRTVLVTGDHAATARAVAEEIGLIEPGGRVVEGSELEALGARRAVEEVARADVFARVTPACKLRIVRALKAGGQVVAMTGDGVNDAPAVKEADIGVAMGRSGADVTREAAAVVLADDSFATLVEAVREGRGVYSNIRKFIRYLLSCNAGEILMMLWGLLLGLPPPLLPTQLLWMNLVTDGLPALALALEPPDADVMRRPPRPRGESLFSGGLARRILLRGARIAGLGLVAFLWGMARGEELAQARTLAFAALVLAQLLHVFDCRSERVGVEELGWASNRYLVGAVALSALMLVLVIYLPPLQPGFHTRALDWADWAVALACAMLATTWLGPGRWLSALGRHFAGFRVRRPTPHRPDGPARGAAV